jgi:hypothetical protein
MSQRVWGYGLFAALIALTSVVACRQLVGITDNPPEDLVTSICGLPYGTNTCASCVSASCCTESTACASDPTCAAYEGCLGKCNGDPKCRSQCTIDNPVGTASDVSALSACLASKCESPCDLECGGVADLISEPDAAVACQQCIAKVACSQAELCASSEACDAYSRSLLAFSTLDSQEVHELLLCGDSAASGLAFNIGGNVDVCGANPAIDPDAGLSSAADSYKFACSTPCATGNYWACVGQGVSWPVPKTTTSTIDLQVTDQRTDAQVIGALAQVCSPGDTTCSSSTELTHGTTDVNGRVSLTFQNLRDPGGHGLNGFVRVTSQNIVPYDDYWGFPLVEADLPFLDAETVTPAELQEEWNAVEATGDPMRGTLDVYVGDCLYQPAPGVKIVLNPDNITQGFSSTGTATTMTDQSGIMFFVNVPAGLTQITATPVALGKPASQVNVTVQPGAVTLAVMYPTPMP